MILGDLIKFNIWFRDEIDRLKRSPRYPKTKDRVDMLEQTAAKYKRMADKLEQTAFLVIKGTLESGRYDWSYPDNSPAGCSPSEKALRVPAGHEGG